MRFALIGGAGYVAPKHMKAIKETGNDLVAVLDPHDSVGILDSYFPDAEFFTEFERFDRYIDKIRREGNKVDYISICSPNYLHDAHCRFVLRSDADAICEKPLSMSPWNVDGLEYMEKETGKTVFNILQLRLHPSIIKLKEQINANGKYVNEVDLTYITSRGKWYLNSWKGIYGKSGGLVFNIGIHFFDMLVWIFGKVQKSIVNMLTDSRAAGMLELDNANVHWFLSVDERDLPKDAGRTFRLISVDGEDLEFSAGFTDLHTESYRKILSGKGFRISDVKPSIELVHQIQTNRGSKGYVKKT